MANRGGISYEPCTLVYNLLSDEQITLSELYLIVRGLHSFMVESITKNEDLNNIHVKLNYQASVANAVNKLGDLQQTVSITKLSAFVKENELSRLDELKRRFNISTGGADDAQTQPKKKTYSRKPVFAPRPAPYQKKAAKKPVFNETEATDDYPGHDPEDE